MDNNTLGARFKRAWNVFMNRDPTTVPMNIGPGYTWQPARPRMSRGNERSIVTTVYNRIALDVAEIKIQHVQLDENGRFLFVIDDGLNQAFNLSANVDQTGRSFKQDIALSLLDEGAIAITPIHRKKDGDFDDFRTGKIVQWYPKNVKVTLYNDTTGCKQDVVISKYDTAIVENPLYAVVNEPNSTLKRLISKLAILDQVDEQSSAGKLDLIIQLPYVLKSEARKEQAEKRRKDIEDQLANTKYGIAYTDGTEHITQLNRPIENNLMKQIEYLTTLLYSQLGITTAILDGTADEKTMMNYYSRTVEPIVAAIVDEMNRKFLTQEQRDGGEAIMFFRDPFKLIPVTQIASIADTMTRNEIMTSNEIRQIIGMKPNEDPRADQLRNKNLNESSEDIAIDEAEAAEQVADDQTIVDEAQGTEEEA